MFNSSGEMFKGGGNGLPGANLILYAIPTPAYYDDLTGYTDLEGYTGAGELFDTIGTSHITLTTGTLDDLMNASWAFPVTTVMQQLDTLEGGLVFFDSAGTPIVRFGYQWYAILNTSFVWVGPEGIAGYSVTQASRASRIQRDLERLNYEDDLTLLYAPLISQAAQHSLAGPDPSWSYTAGLPDEDGVIQGTVPMVHPGKGLMAMGAYTNIAVASDATLSNWTKGFVNVSGDTVTVTTADNLHYVTSSSISFTSGITYHSSIVLKANGYNFVRLSFSSSVMPSAERAAYFNLAAGTLGTVESNVDAKITSLGDGWYRCSICRAATSTASAPSLTVITTPTNGIISYIGDGVSGVRVKKYMLVNGTTYQYPYCPPAVSVPATSATSGVGVGFAMDAAVLACFEKSVTDGVEIATIANTLAAWSVLLGGVTNKELGATGIVVTSTSAGGYRYPMTGFVVGKSYKFNFRTRVVSGGISVACRVNDGSVDIYTGDTAGDNNSTSSFVSFSKTITATTTALSFYIRNGGAGVGEFSLDSVQKLQPSTLTAAALVYMGAASAELPDSSTLPLVTVNSTTSTGIITRVATQTARIIARGYDGTAYANSSNDQAWNRDEIHLKIIQTNSTGTQFRAGNQRFTSAMVEVDADIVWGSWADYDGSFNPLTHLRLAYNGVVPIWIKGLFVSNIGGMSDADILSRCREFIA